MALKQLLALNLDQILAPVALKRPQALNLDQLMDLRPPLARNLAQLMVLVPKQPQVRNLVQ